MHLSKGVTAHSLKMRWVLGKLNKGWFEETNSLSKEIL
jgi:hypothetical protein